MPKQRPASLSDLDLLLGDLCREWGFCNRLTAADLVAAGTVLSDIEFAHAVLWAENMNPEYEAKWVERIREKFAGRYGPSFSIND